MEHESTLDEPGLPDVQGQSPFAFSSIIKKVRQIQMGQDREQALIPNPLGKALSNRLMVGKGIRPPRGASGEMP